MKEPSFKKSPEPNLPCQSCGKIECVCDSERKQYEEDTDLQAKQSEHERNE
jgi:hypothetical protein